MKDNKLLNIDDIINILSGMKERHGNLPFYLLYDDFVNIHIDRVVVAKESKSHHEHNPATLPKRIICMGGTDSQFYEEDA